jgi:hypothetical protein
VERYAGEELLIWWPERGLGQDITPKDTPVTSFLQINSTFAGFYHLPIM